MQKYRFELTRYPQRNPVCVRRIEFAITVNRRALSDCGILFRTIILGDLAIQI